MRVAAGSGERGAGVDSTSSKAAALPPPVPAIAALERTQDPGHEIATLVNLDRNERVDPLPEWFMERVRQSIDSALLTHYPMQDILRQRLAASLGLAESHVLLTPGSDGAVRALYQAYVRSGDTVVMLEPSYAMYAVYARMVEAQVCQIPFGPKMELDT